MIHESDFFSTVSNHTQECIAIVEQEYSLEDAGIHHDDCVCIPMPPFPIEILDEHGARVANPFTGDECFLNPVALAVYDMVKGAEMMQEYMVVRVGIDWFIEHYPAEYMVLLD